MLKLLLAHFDRIIFTRYINNPRGVPPEELVAVAKQLPSVRAADMEFAPTPTAAWSAVHRLAKPDDLICITGSFFLASEMRREIAARPMSSDLL